LLVVRELLCGSRRFGEIRRGIPQISRTMLSSRLRELADAGLVVREEGPNGPLHRLTAAGLELAGTLKELGTWGQRWLSRRLSNEELDLDALAWDMRRRVDLHALPPAPVVVRIEAIRERGLEVRFLLLRRSEVSLCSTNPGFPAELCLRAPIRTLTGWWRGDLSLAEARSAGLVLQGRREWVRAFPAWFERYAFAGIPPASG
jgi:DNA-binding HxlR family transcriptional regulator